MQRLPPPGLVASRRQRPAKARGRRKGPTARVAVDAALAEAYGASWPQQLQKLLDAGRVICDVTVVLT